MNVHCKTSSVPKRVKKIYLAKNFPNQVFDQVFDQLKEQNISLQEVANDIDVQEILARISQYKEKFSEERTAKL